MAKMTEKWQFGQLREKDGMVKEISLRWQDQYKKDDYVLISHQGKFKF